MPVPLPQAYLQGQQPREEPAEDGAGRRGDLPLILAQEILASAWGGASGRCHPDLSVAVGQ